MGYLKNVEIAISTAEFNELPRNKQAAYLKAHPTSKHQRRGPGKVHEDKKDATALKRKPTADHKINTQDKIDVLKEQIRDLQKLIKEKTGHLPKVSAKRKDELEKYIEHLKKGISSKQEKITELKTKKV